MRGLVIGALLALAIVLLPAGTGWAGEPGDPADELWFLSPDAEAWSLLRTQFRDSPAYDWGEVEGIPWMRRSTDVVPVTIMWDSRARQWYRIPDDHGLNPKQMHDYAVQYCQVSTGCVVAPAEIAGIYQDPNLVEFAKKSLGEAQDILTLVEGLRADLGPAGTAWETVLANDMAWWPANIRGDSFVSQYLFDRDTRDKTAETLQWLYTRLLEQGIDRNAPVMQRLRSLADRMGFDLIPLAHIEEVFSTPDSTPQPSPPTPTPTARPAATPTLSVETAQQRADRIAAEYRRIFPVWIKAESAKVAEITQVYGEQIVIEANAVPMGANKYQVKWYGWRMVSGKQQRTRSADVSASVDELASWTEMHKADLKKWGVAY